MGRIPLSGFRDGKSSCGEFGVLSTRLHGLLADLSTCVKPQGGTSRYKFGAEYSGNYSGRRRGGMFAARHAPELGCTKLVLTSSNTRNGNGPAFYLAVGIPSNHLGHCFDVDHLHDIPLEKAKPRIRHDLRGFYFHSHSSVAGGRGGETVSGRCILHYG